MLILLAQLMLVVSLAAIVLQHAGVEILQPFYSAIFGPETGLIIAYLFTLASAAATAMLRMQRSRRRRTKMGFTFPSELHAQWTTHLDDLGIPWRYHNEPLCAGGHHMQIQIGEQTLCAVVLNTSKLSERVAAKVSASGCRSAKAILGNYPQLKDGAVGWFQNEPDAPWRPIPVSA